MPLMAEEKKSCLISGAMTRSSWSATLQTLGHRIRVKMEAPCAVLLTRFFVSSLMSGWRWSARDTVDADTRPAWLCR